MEFWDVYGAVNRGMPLDEKLLVERGYSGGRVYTEAAVTFRYVCTACPVSLLDKIKAFECNHFFVDEVT